MCKHILLIDDEPLFRYSVELALRKKGHLVAQAGDGEHAWTLLLEAEKAGVPYNLVLLDLELPTSSGLDFMRRLGSRTNAPPVLVVSGYWEPELEQELASLGCEGMLQKPVSEKVLMRRIAEVLTRH